MNIQYIYCTFVYSTFTVHVTDEVCVLEPV